MRFGRRLGALVLAALGLMAGAAVAEEATCDTLITTVPYTITVQGHYCLADHITVTNMTIGSAITIDSNAVVLDLRGYKLLNFGAGTGTQAFGISVLNRNYVVIRNGAVRGFMAGISLEGGGIGTNHNNLVEDINADINTAYRVTVGVGQNNTIRNCIVTGTGGSTAPGTSG